jgi:hypothetical protein
LQVQAQNFLTKARNMGGACVRASFRQQPDSAQHPTPSSARALDIATPKLSWTQELASTSAATVLATTLWCISRPPAFSLLYALGMACFFACALWLMRCALLEKMYQVRMCIVSTNR